MTLEDIKPSPIIIDFEGEELKLEFDNHSIALAEQNTKKGVFNIQKLLFQNDLSLNDCIEVFCAALAKHHNLDTIKKIREKVTTNPYILNVYNNSIIAAFIQPLIAPEVYRKIIEKEPKTAKKK